MGKIASSFLRSGDEFIMQYLDYIMAGVVKTYCFSLNVDDF